MEDKKIKYKHDTDILWRVNSIRTSSAMIDGDNYLEARLYGVPQRSFGIGSFDHIRNELNSLLDNGFSKPKIDKVIYNDPATIILWADGSKTVVKCQEGDTYNPETGFVMAYLKKMLGNDNTFNKEILKHVPEQKKVEEPEKTEKVEDQDYYKLQQERAKLMRILDYPKMLKKDMVKLISEVVDGIDNIVMGEEAEEPKKRDTDFKVGDLVRIRSWDDMAKEFGVDYNGDITCKCYFNHDMRRLCGIEFKITGFDEYDESIVEGLELVVAEEDRYWCISTDMIEKVNK